MDVSGIACLGSQQSASLELGFRWIFPFACSAIALLTPLVAQPLSWALSRFFPGGRIERIGGLLGLTFFESFQVVMWCAVLFFTTLVSYGLLLLTCVANPNMRLTVRAFPHLECPSAIGPPSQEWLQLLGPCLVYLVVVVFGVLSLVMMAWRQMVAAAAHTHLTSRGPWAFLVADLRTSHLHWIAVSLLHGLIMNALAVYTTNISAQLLITSGFSALFGVFTLTEQPYAEPLSNFSKFWTSLCVAATCALAATGLQAEGGFSPTLDGTNGWRGVSILVLQVAGAAGPLLFAAVSAGLRTSLAVRHVSAAFRPLTGDELRDLLVKMREGLLQAANPEVLWQLDKVELGRLNHFLSSSTPLLALVTSLNPSMVGGFTTRQLQKAITRLSLASLAAQDDVTPVPAATLAEDKEEEERQDNTVQALRARRSVDSSQFHLEPVLPGHVPT